MDENKNMASKIDQERKIVKDIAKQLFDLQFKDQNGIDNYRFDQMTNEYFGLYCPLIEKWIDTIFEKQKEKKESYGDYDWTVTIIKNTPEKRVLFFDNHCTCADINQFIIIQDYRKDYKKTTHIRLVWGKSDYRKGNNYVHRPNLKWYEDRGYDLEFNDKWHTGPLGGSYADCRDQGFLMTFSKDLFTHTLLTTAPIPELQSMYDEVKKYREERGEYDVEDGSIYCYPDLKRAIGDLAYTAQMLNEENK